MKAAVLQAFKQPLVWQEVDTPVPGPDEVLVQVMACGIDGTDLKLLDGFGYTPALPFVIGHEVAGLVAEVGEGVNGFEPGERVIVYNFTTCGDCLPCRTHREQICVNMGGVLGAKDRHGGYAEYLSIPARQLVRVSERVPWQDNAVCCDAGMTGFHAVDRAGLRLGESVLIIGVGGVGSMAVQLAKAAGARVLAVEQSEAKADWACKLGADEVLYAEGTDIPAAVRERTDGQGVDCVIDIVGLTETMGAGINALRNGGRLVVVGYTPDFYPVEGKYLAQNELTIIGTRAGRKQDLINVSRLMAEGKIRSIVNRTFPMEEANEALAVLRTGDILGRIVLLTPAGRQAMDD